MAQPKSVLGHTVVSSRSAGELYILETSLVTKSNQIKSNSTLLRIIVYNNISKILIKNTCKHIRVNIIIILVYRNKIVHYQLS